MAFPLATSTELQAPLALNAMTVDVEDYYHAHALETYFTRDSWPNLERRVEARTQDLLDLFDRKGAKATFFTLGNVAREYPRLIRDIVARGHELASHGLDHYRASDQDPTTFREDVSTAKKALEDAGGVEVRGYRAASFSIDQDNWWAFDVLEEVGYRYSSSNSASKLAGSHMAIPDTPFFPGQGDLVEIPITTVNMLGRDVPTGGGYFRLAPYGFFRSAMQARHSAQAGPVNFYTHPWEIDPGQPKAEVSLKNQIRHRINLGRMLGKLDKTLTDFAWGTISEVFAPALGAQRPLTTTEAR